MQNFVCLAARNHPRVGARLTRKRFEAEAHAVVASSGTGHAIVDKTIARLGLRRQRYTTQIEHYDHLAATCDAIAVCSRG